MMCPERIPIAATRNLSVIMPGLVPGTHVFRATKQGVGGRDKPGHDALGDRVQTKPALAYLLVLLLLAPSATFAAGRIDIPIKQTVLTDGTIRYSIPIAIGGSSPIDIMLDSGSTGLRMLPGAAPDSAHAASNQPSVYGYGSGVRLNGVVAKVPVGIGGASAPISVQLVRTIDCFPSSPKCPASRLSQAEYGIGGDGLPGQGFRGIAGVGLATGPVGNPLTEIGAHSWIISLPRPGQPDLGKLIIDPAPSELSGYLMLPISAAGGFHDGVSGCFIIEKSQKNICGWILLDTGAPGIHIGSGNAADTGGWARDDAIRIVFRNGQGGEVAGKFMAGAGPPSRISTGLDPKLAQPSIAAGTVPYFLFSVFYDAGQNRIGFKPR
jgi:hypothetical protein